MDLLCRHVIEPDTCKDPFIAHVWRFQLLDLSMLWDFNGFSVFRPEITKTREHMCATNHDVDLFKPVSSNSPWVIVFENVITNIHIYNMHTDVASALRKCNNYAGRDIYKSKNRLCIASQQFSGNVSSKRSKGNPILPEVYMRLCPSTVLDLKILKKFWLIPAANIRLK